LALFFSTWKFKKSIESEKEFRETLKVFWIERNNLHKTQNETAQQQLDAINDLINIVESSVSLNIGHDPAAKPLKRTK